MSKKTNETLRTLLTYTTVSADQIAEIRADVDALEKAEAADHAAQDKIAADQTAADLIHNQLIDAQDVVAADIEAQQTTAGAVSLAESKLLADVTAIVNPS